MEAATPELTEDPQLEFGFLLHDIGKIGVPDAVLLKPGPLNEEELEIVRGHALLRERLLRRIPYLSGTARLTPGCGAQREQPSGECAPPIRVGRGRPV